MLTLPRRSEWFSRSLRQSTGRGCPASSPTCCFLRAHAQPPAGRDGLGLRQSRPGLRGALYQSHLPFVFINSLFFCLHALKSKSAEKTTHSCTTTPITTHVPSSPKVLWCRSAIRPARHPALQPSPGSRSCSPAFAQGHGHEPAQHGAFVLGVSSRGPAVRPGHRPTRDREGPPAPGSAGWRSSARCSIQLGATTKKAAINAQVPLSGKNEFSFSWVNT